MDIVGFFKYVEENDLQYFLTDPHARHTEKKDRMTSAWIQASRAAWKEQGRELTEDEKNQVIRDAERAYNREMRQKRKTTVKQIAAVL